MGLIFSKAKPKRIAVLGLDAAGKITIMKLLNSEGLNIPVIPRLQQNESIYQYLLKTMEYKGMNFVAWDIGGQRRDKWIMRRCYLESTDAIIYVLDSNDHERLEEALEELNTLLDHFKTEKLPLPKALLILANKQDLPNAMSTSNIEEKLDLPEHIKLTTVWRMFGTTAIHNKGVQEGVAWLMDELQPNSD